MNPFSCLFLQFFHLHSFHIFKFVPWPNAKRNRFLINPLYLPSPETICSGVYFDKISRGMTCVWDYRRLTSHFNPQMSIFTLDIQLLEMLQIRPSSTDINETSHDHYCWLILKHLYLIMVGDFQ